MGTRLSRKNRFMVFGALLCVVCGGLSAGSAAAQGEIGEGARVVFDQPNVVTEIAEEVSIGDQRLSVGDVDGIQGGDEARLVLRSTDGEVQQAACLARLKDREIRLASDESGDSRWPTVKLDQPVDIRLEEYDLVLQGESEFVSGQGEGVVAVTRLATERGAEVIAVDDVSKIDPWLKIGIRSGDGAKQEIRCPRAVIGALGSTRDDRDDSVPYFSIIGELDNEYAEGAEIFQGAGSEGGDGVVAALASALDRGAVESVLDSLDKLDPFEDVLIRSLDGSEQEIHCIQSIDASTKKIKFTQDVAGDFDAGAEIVQGSDVARALMSRRAKDRTKGCECCGEGGAAWWWLASLAAVPVAVDDDAPPADEPPALSPIVP